MTPPVNGNSALFLDIDGTLLDIARTPDAVTVPGELKTSLKKLHDDLDGALAFVSGRSLAAIDGLFAPLTTAAIGCHGVEVRGVDGTVEALAPPIPDSVRELFRGLARRHSGVLLEDKGYGLSLHYREVPEAGASLHAALEKEKDRLTAMNIALLEGKAVIDARPSGIDKGVGVRALMDQKPFRGRHVLFGGDDTTDQDVFHILPEIGGAGFSVGKIFPGAEYLFESPEAVRQWLTRLAVQGVAA